MSDIVRVVAPMLVTAVVLLAVELAVALWWENR